MEPTPPGPPASTQPATGQIHLSAFIAFGATLAFAIVVLVRLLLASAGEDGPSLSLRRTLTVLHAVKLCSLGFVAIGLVRTARDRRNPPVVAATALGGLIAILVVAF